MTIAQKAATIAWLRLKQEYKMDIAPTGVHFCGEDIPIEELITLVKNVGATK